MQVRRHEGAFRGEDACALVAAAVGYTGVEHLLQVEPRVLIGVASGLQRHAPTQKPCLAALHSHVTHDGPAVFHEQAAATRSDTAVEGARSNNGAHVCRHGVVQRQQASPSMRGYDERDGLRRIGCGTHTHQHFGYVSPRTPRNATTGKKQSAYHAKGM